MQDDLYFLHMTYINSFVIEQSFPSMKDDRLWILGTMKFDLTPVAESIFGPLFQSFFHQRDLNRKISSSALLDIQLTLLCVCGVNSFIPELEHLPVYKKKFTVSFPKRRLWNLGALLLRALILKWSSGQLLRLSKSFPTRLLELLEKRSKI